MSVSYPDSRTVWRALGVIERLPVAALADLVELLVDRLDEAMLDPDLEPEEDCCDLEVVLVLLKRKPMSQDRLCQRIRSLITLRAPSSE